MSRAIKRCSLNDIKVILRMEKIPEDAPVRRSARKRSLAAEVSNDVGSNDHMFSKSNTRNRPTKTRNPS